MKKYVALFAVAFIALPSLVSAHEVQQFLIGGEKYEFAVGSLNEPVVVDDKTGLDLRIKEVHEGMSEDHHSAGGAVEGLEATLQVEMIAGDVKKVTPISPVYNMPGSYKNAFYPTVATTLSYRIFGTIHDVPVDITFTCSPAGHAKATEDKTETKISDTVTRTLKTGGFGCPAPKEELGFPEKASTAVELEKKAASSKTLALIALALAAASLVFVAVSRKK